MEPKLLEIGDKILVDTNFLNIKRTYTITKVTKTKAVGITDDGLIEFFKREYVYTNYIRPWKWQKWDRTDRILIK